MAFGEYSPLQLEETRREATQRQRRRISQPSEAFQIFQNFFLGLFFWGAKCFKLKGTKEKEEENKKRRPILHVCCCTFALLCSSLHSCAPQLRCMH